MLSIIVIYAVYFLLCLGLFGFLRRDCRVTIAWTMGWLLLPVSFYPQTPLDSTDFPYWIVGLALPADLWPNKLWVVNVTALTCVCIYEPQRWKQFRWTGWDVAMLLWCSWPLAQRFAGIHGSPTPFFSAVYLSGVWGASWLIGRLCLRSDSEKIEFLRWLVLLTACAVPLALSEWLLGPGLYEWVWWQVHPFRFDGQQRYFGFRPLLFFEHGNQYGLWMGMVAAIGFWFWISKIPLLKSGGELLQAYGDRFLVATLMMVAVLSQSVGAILLMVAAVASLLVLPRLKLRAVMMAAALLVALGGLLYLSNLGSLRTIAKETALGRKAVEIIRQTGRGSFSWRIGQDAKALPEIRDHWLMGTGRWDWWRELDSRPWGYCMLLLGQYGFIGVGLNLAVGLGPSLRTLYGWPGGTACRLSALSVLCGVVIVASSADGLLNAFLFVPSLLLTASLVE
jgi:O-Antigen ligase